MSRSRHTWGPKVELKTRGMRVSLDKMQGFPAHLEKKIRETAAYLELMFQSEEFFESILNHTYNGKRQFHQNNGMSNAEIYDYIMTGREPLQSTSKVDKLMNLHLIHYYDKSTTVGYGFTNSDKIYCNGHWYERYTHGDIARNLVHEWLHNMGFKHAVRYSKARDYTVPYAIGNLTDRIVTEMKKP